MSVCLKSHHLKMAAELVAETDANGGLAPLDLAAFWRDQDAALANAWADHCPQIPLGMASMSRECVFAELGEPEDFYRLVHDDDYAVDRSRRYNDRAEAIVGRRILHEKPVDPALCWPQPKMLHDLFEARNEWHVDSYWMHQSADNPAELAALLDRVEKRLENSRQFFLPENWAEEKARLNALGVKPPLYRGQRGPITFATSVYGVENLIYLLMDEPALAGRFRDLILRGMIERGRVLDEEAGFTRETAPRGFWLADDNSALLNEEMYEFFGAPILQGLFEYYAPSPEDTRYQHSDSDMGHLLPILGRLGLTGANFGPNVMISEIRKHLPRALIQGQLAPFTFSRNERVNMVAEFLRDAEMIREGGTKGLIFATAGSINNGSRLTGLRLLMAAAQRWGRY